MTCALRGARAPAAHALAAPIARKIALTALAALGLSKDPFHEPFHARGLVLQARAEEPVQADVGEPDQGQGHDEAVGLRS